MAGARRVEGVEGLAQREAAACKPALGRGEERAPKRSAKAMDGRGSGDEGRGRGEIAGDAHLGRGEEGAVLEEGELISFREDSGNVGALPS